MWHCQIHGISFVWSDGCPACRDSGEEEAARRAAVLPWSDPASDPAGDVRRMVEDVRVHAPCQNQIAELQRENDRLQQENVRLRAGRGGWGDRA